MTTTSACATDDALLIGERVAFVGRLAGMSRREAQQLVRQNGGSVVDKPDDTVTLLVVGDMALLLGEGALEETFDPGVREAIDRQSLSVINETQLWQRLRLIERQQHIHNLYTPAMLSKLLGVSVPSLRRWQRRGWIVPVREVRRLPYFDFQEVATARRLTELLAAGVSPGAIERNLAALSRFLPDVKRPLAQLSVIVEGKDLLVRQADGLVETGGQLRFDFQPTQEVAPAVDQALLVSDVVRLHAAGRPPATVEEMLRMAGRLEEAGQWDAAADMYRASMAAEGPTADTCFELAELLYQMHDLPAARERYYMAIELDEDFVEARANLGCVLADLGETDLAISAFEGALLFHDDYPDVHYHLGRILDQVGRAGEALLHWQAFLRLAPTSPWADEARQRLDS